MSGGSFNYLFTKDTNELLGSLDDLERMATQLDKFSDGGKAAEDTMSVRDTIIQMMELIEIKATALHNVWHAVEWVESGDSLPEQAENAIQEYNKG